MMKRLTKSNYDKAVSYLKHQARPLERALYEHHFAGAAADNALKELERFQNRDGGFGHGLEPDIRLGDSSVIATTIAIQRFRELHAPADHPMIAKACRYLLETYDAERMNWPIIPPHIDDAPHAPWWVHSGDLEKSMINPRAEIAGYVNDYAQLFPDDMRRSVTESVVAYLNSQPDKMEMHDLLCYTRLWESPRLPADTKTAVLDKLRRIVEQTVERDPAQWRNYGLPPLAVITSPESPFADIFAEAIPHNLDFIVESQREDGAWRPNWSWGDQWPDAWAQAEREWAGVLTLDHLRKLRAFGANF
jgi:hypothetical protein